MKNHLVTVALIVVLVFAGAACGKKDAAPAAASSPEEQVRTVSEAAGTAENLGQKIGSSYVLTLEQAVAMVKDRLPAEELKTMLKEMKTGTIDIMVGLGKEREALSPEDRAVVDSVINRRIASVPMDLFNALRDGQTHYKDDAELFNLIADFNIISQYANFDLLKKQLPEEALRLGIQ